MARITVEDCVDKVANRFDLVLLAAHRARTIAKGAAITVEPENDKNAVIALREIAENQLSIRLVRVKCFAWVTTGGGLRRQIHV